MLRRLASWWEAQREAGALHGIISGLVIAAIGVVLLAPWGRTPRPKKLSKKAQDHLCRRAAELAPSAIDFARELSVKTREIDEATDAEAIERYSAWIVAWSERFTSELEAEIAAIAANEGVSADEVRGFLGEKLRELTGECVPELSVMPGSPRGYVLASPRLKFVPVTVEQAMEAAIQHLVALLPKLPSQGQEGLKKAILALRRAIAPFDTKPIAIAFTAPAPNSVVNFIPAISFEMTDTGSGPNPATRKLVAVNTGPIVQQTTDLTNFTQVTLDDQVNGKVAITASGILPTAVQDGFITLKASGTDFAGNPSSSASRTMVLDRVPPAIAFMSPANGSTVTSTSVPLNAVIHDEVSGVKLSSLSVALNGVDVTSLVTISPGPNNPVGAPNDVTLAGALSAAIGSNMLQVTTLDLAGNASTGISTFTVAIASNIVLLNIAGDNQEGLGWKCTNAPLTVQAVDTSLGNAPVRGLQLSYRFLAGSGVAVQDKGFATDENGMATFKVRLGQHPQTNVLEVGVIGRPQVQPVTFTLTTVKPSLTNVTQSGPCNFQPSTFEVAGSAVSQLIRVRLVDNQNNPLKGQDISPLVSEFNNQSPPSFDVGQFLPEQGVTDENGEAVFAFVINKGTPTGSFTMRFQASAFIDEMDKPIKLDVAGSVIPGSFNFAQINYDSLTTSGQAQTGAPNFELALPLRAKIINGQEGTISFFILEGTGEFTEVTEGFKESESADSCGNPVVLVHTTPDGRAAVRFKKGAGVTHALIGIRGAPIGPPLDVFAVGIPELRLVQASDPSNRLFGIFLEEPSDPDPTLRFVLEARLPVGFNQPVNADLKSFDACDVPLNEPNGVAPSSLTSIPLGIIAVDPSNRFWIYRSTTDTPFSAVDATIFPGESVPTVSDAQLIQLIRGGLISETLNAGTFTITSRQDQQVEILRSEFTFDRTNEDDIFALHLQRLFNKGDGVQWKLERVGGTQSVTTNISDFKAGTLFVKFSSQQPDGFGKGTEDNPLNVKLTRDNANRRAIYRVTASGTGMAKPSETIVYVGLGHSTTLTNITAAPATKDALNTTFGFFANPANFAGLAEDFGGQTALAIFNGQTQTGTNAQNTLEVNKRLIFAGHASPTEPDSNATTVTARVPIFTPGQLNTISDLTFKIKDVGVAIWEIGRTNSDLIDLTAIVRHEEFHVRQSLGQTPEATLIQDVFNDIVGQLFERFPNSEALREANLNVFLRGAIRYSDAVAELEAYTEDLVKWAADPNASATSVSFLRGDIGGMVVGGYMPLLTFLTEGIAITLSTGATENFKVKAATKAKLVTYINIRVIGKLENLDDTVRGIKKIYKPMISRKVYDTTLLMSEQESDSIPLRATLRKVE